MVKISVQSLREDYKRAQAENRTDSPTFTRGVHISSIVKDASGKESIRISKGAKANQQRMNISNIEMFRGASFGSTQNSYASSASASRSLSSKNASELMHKITSEYMSVQKEAGTERDAKLKQQQKLKKLLEAAVSRNKKMEDQFQGQIIKLNKGFGLKLEAAGAENAAALRQMKEEQERMAETIKDLEDELAEAKKDDDDDADIEALSNTIVMLREKIAQLQLPQQKRSKEDKEKISLLRRKVVQLEGSMAMEKVPPLKEVLAGRQMADMAEDIYILQYDRDEYPRELADGSKRLWLMLTFPAEHIEQGNAFEFCIQMERVLPLKKLGDQVAFGIEIIGPRSYAQDFIWSLNENEKGQIRSIKKGDTGQSLNLKRCGFIVEEARNFPPGEYRINLVTTRGVKKKYTNYVVVPEMERWFIRPKAPPRVPTPPKQDCFFGFVDKLLRVKQSEVNVYLTVQRTKSAAYFGYSYKTTGKLDRGFYSMSGTASFNAGDSRSKIRFSMDQTPQDQPQTELTVQVFDGGSQCGCEVDQGQEAFKLIIENDLKWSHVRFTAVDEMKFRYSDRTALFQVERTDGRGDLDIPWQATRVESQRIWKEGIWSMMRGHLKFLDNETIAYIQFDFPLQTAQMAPTEEVELVLFGTRHSQYAPVKITDGFDKRRFQIMYESDEVIPRPDMDKSELRSRGYMLRSTTHADLRGPQLDRSMSRSYMSQQDHSETGHGLSQERNRELDTIRMVGQSQQMHSTMVRQQRRRSSASSSVSSGNDRNSAHTRSRAYRNIQTLSGVIRHEAQIISINRAEVKWPTIRTDFLDGFVIVWWPRYQINENMSTVVDANTFKCVIELAEEDTEYEIMVVPETSARPIQRHRNEHGKFAGDFIQNLIGPKVLPNNQPSSTMEHSSPSQHDSTTSHRMIRQSGGGNSGSTQHTPTRTTRQVYHQ